MDTIRTSKTPQKTTKEVVSIHPPSGYTSFLTKNEEEKPKTIEERFTHIDQAFLAISEEISKVYLKKTKTKTILTPKTVV